MPKSIFVDPNEMRAPGKIHFEDIPVNTYQKSFAESAKDFSKTDLMRIYHDMQVNRIVETMLKSVRTTKEWRGVEYKYVGPAHLSLGQEAAAVGSAFYLDADDIIMGGHRGHGEVLCRGMAAIDRLPEAELQRVMETFHNGDLLRAVEKHNTTGDVRDLARDFFLYGFCCELFGRTNGFNCGLGNSMHIFFIPFGIFPNNAIVGASAPIACGVGLFKKVHKKPGIVVCNLGDGSLGCGPVLEAFNFASMRQFDNLWGEGYEGGLPIIFNVTDNHYGMGGQTGSETMGYEQLARMGAGFAPNQMYAERVDGYNPFAVMDAFKRKKALIKDHKAPVLLDVISFRQTGHSVTDGLRYRTPEEDAAWVAQDSIAAYKKGLEETGTASVAEIEAVEQSISDRVLKVMKLAIDDSVSPRPDFVKDPDVLRKIVYTNKHVEKLSDEEPMVVGKYEDNERVQKIAKKSRWGLDKNGKPMSDMKAVSLRDALYEAILSKYYVDPTLVNFGEDVRDWGGSFGVHLNMMDSVPYQRLFNAPISESTIVSAAVGYALCGGRAMPELMYCDFLGRAGDEVFNQMAKWQSMSAGELDVPVILRVSCGAKYGAQHAQDWTGLCTHIPGLKVVYPVTPYDAKGLMNAALAGTDPVVFFESQKLYSNIEQYHEGGVPEEYYEIPIGEPDIKKAGSDLTIITYGPTLYPSMAAAKRLEEEFGISAEVIDLRSLVPLNYAPLVESIKKTGRVVIASDACERGSFSNDVARNLTEYAFDYLDAPPVVVGAPNAISPCPELESYYYPQASWILDAVNEKILPLKGYTAQMNFTTVEKMRRESLGI